MLQGATFFPKCFKDQAVQKQNLPGFQCNASRAFLTSLRSKALNVGFGLEVENSQSPSITAYCKRIACGVPCGACDHLFTARDTLGRTAHGVHNADLPVNCTAGNDMTQLRVKHQRAHSVLMYNCTLFSALTKHEQSSSYEKCININTRCCACNILQLGNQSRLLVYSTEETFSMLQCWNQMLVDFVCSMFAVSHLSLSPVSPLPDRRMCTLPSSQPAASLSPFALHALTSDAQLGITYVSRELA